jgi:hypothetical protein
MKDTHWFLVIWSNTGYALLVCGVAIEAGSFVISTDDSPVFSDQHS